MQISSFVVQLTGLTPQQLFGGQSPMVVIAQDGDGNVSFPTWQVPNVSQPTAQQIAAALSAPTPVSELAGYLSSNANAVATALQLQVLTDQVHAVAYQNAAAVVMAGGGQPPSTQPLEDAFNAQASAFGMTPAQFATTSIAVMAASMTLSATLATCQASCASARSVDDLRSALTAFENGIAGMVTSLNGTGLAITVTAPTPISIVGINA